MYARLDRDRASRNPLAHQPEAGLISRLFRRSTSTLLNRPRENPDQQPFVSVIPFSSKPKDTSALTKQLAAATTTHEVRLVISAIKSHRLSHPSTAFPCPSAPEPDTDLACLEAAAKFPGESDLIAELLALVVPNGPMPQAGSVEHVPHIIHVLKQNRTDVIIVRAACSALVPVFSNPLSNNETTLTVCHQVAEYVVATIRQTMDKPDERCDVLMSCLELLCFFSAVPEGPDFLMQVKAGEVLLSLLRKLQLKFGQLGYAQRAPAVIVLSILQHLASAARHEAALNRLHAVSVVATLLLQTKPRLTHSNIRNSENMDIWKAGCGALAALTSNPLLVAKATRQGAASCFIEAVVLDLDVDTLTFAFQGLRNVTRDASVLKDMASNGNLIRLVLNLSNDRYNGPKMSLLSHVLDLFQLALPLLGYQRISDEACTCLTFLAKIMFHDKYLPEPMRRRAQDLFEGLHDDKLSMAVLVAAIKTDYGIKGNDQALVWLASFLPDKPNHLLFEFPVLTSFDELAKHSHSGYSILEFLKVLIEKLGTDALINNRGLHRVLVQLACGSAAEVDIAAAIFALFDHNAAFESTIKLVALSIKSNNNISTADINSVLNDVLGQCRRSLAALTAYLDMGLFLLLQDLLQLTSLSESPFDDSLAELILLTFTAQPAAYAQFKALWGSTQPIAKASWIYLFARRAFKRKDDRVIRFLLNQADDVSLAVYIRGLSQEFESEANGDIVAQLVEFAKAGQRAALVEIGLHLNDVLRVDPPPGPTLDLVELLLAGDCLPPNINMNAALIAFFAREALTNQRAMMLLCRIEPKFHVDDQAINAMSKHDLVEGATCAICRDILRGPMACLPCNHAFCGTCLQGWTAKSNTCPMCRGRIVGQVLSLKSMYMLRALKEQFQIVELDDADD